MMLSGRSTAAGIETFPALDPRGELILNIPSKCLECAFVVCVLRDDKRRTAV
jgi:hypothetical protein